MSKLFIGLMSGTSADSVDTVLLSVSEEKIKSLGTYTHPIPDKVKNSIYESVNSQKLDKNKINKLDMVLAEIFSEAVNALLMQECLKSQDVEALGSHGQTIKHSPNLPVPF